MEISHTPDLRWVTRQDGRKCIYDGQLPVCVLNEGPYPVAFQDLRLIPGGSPLVAANESDFPVGIAWRNTGKFQIAIDNITVRHVHPSRLEIDFTMHDCGLTDHRDPEAAQWQPATEQNTTVAVTFDPALGTYVFEFRSQLSVKKGRESAISRERFPSGLEYQDLYPSGCFDRFPPHGKKRFAWFLYQGTDGRWYKRPHTHHLGPDKFGIRFCPGGRLAYVSDTEYNPVVELVGETACMTSGVICWWSWDFHFLISSPEEHTAQWERPLEVHYKIYSLPHAEAFDLLNRATLDPVLNTASVHSPVFQIAVPNHFEPSEDCRVPSDGWFWQSHNGPYSNHFEADPCCIWDQTAGWRTPGALRIKKPSAGRSFWACNALGNSYPPNTLPGSQFRVSAMVKTQDLAGRAFLGWEFRRRIDGVPGALERRPAEYSAQSMEGTNDWTELSFETSKCPDFAIAGVYLIQEGTGTTWFDEVRILEAG